MPTENNYDAFAIGNQGKQMPLTVEEVIKWTITFAVIRSMNKVSIIITDEEDSITTKASRASNLIFRKRMPSIFFASFNEPSKKNYVSHSYISKMKVFNCLLVPTVNKNSVFVEQTRIFSFDKDTNFSILKNRKDFIYCFEKKNTCKKINKIWKHVCEENLVNCWYLSKGNFSIPILPSFRAT